MSIVTGPAASSAARSAGSKSSIRAVAAARPASAACQCAGVIRRARPARWWSQPRHRRDLLPRLISALPVQPDQEVLPGQLGRGDPGQQLPAAEPPLPLLDRADGLIQRRGHAELGAQLGDRGQARFGVSDGSAAPIRTC